LGLYLLGQKQLGANLSGLRADTETGLSPGEPLLRAILGLFGDDT